MLARTPATLVYLSAEELGITERERAGLIEVRDDLARGRVKHVPITGASEELCPNSELFNMAEWRSRTDCGTAHCIGGFMKARGTLSDNVLGSTALSVLFGPIGVGSYADLGVEQAVRAIDCFLAGAGAECWPMALADIPPA